VQEFVALLSGQELAMKTSSVAVLAWTGSWADADAEAALLQQQATPRG
jgi:phosphohistidine phosphatase SixA